MKTRISAIVCLLCVLGYAEVTRAEDPYNQRVADPYAISPDPPTMSSGTIEPYLSFMAGMAIPFSQDATFRNGDVDEGECRLSDETVDRWQRGALVSNQKQVVGIRSRCVKSPAIFGIRTWPAVGNNFNGVTDPDGSFQGTTTEMQGIYVGSNFLIRYPMAISEAYPNGRWYPYVGIGGGAHQMAYEARWNPWGCVCRTPITDQRDTTVAFQAVGGFKVHLFKYVAAFAEAKYLHAHHSGLGTDRFGVNYAPMVVYKVIYF